MKKVITYLLILFLVIFTRFYNIDRTSRFIWDESSDLVSIHRIWEEKDITLIGPVSEDGNKVFGSLTYYLLLPFAIFYNFSPLSTTIGASFYGVVISFVLIYLSYKVRGQLETIPILLTSFWSIILIHSRWAWNPNFMLLWSSLAIILYISKLRYRYFLTGLFLAINLHHHYLSFYSLIFFGLVVLYESYKERSVYKVGQFIIGCLIPVIPFVAFDLTHKPGLFLTRVLYFNYLNTEVSLFQKLGGGNLLFLLNLIPIIYYDIKNKSKSLVFIFVFLLSSLVILLTTPFYSHYLLAGIPFLFTYLIYKRNGIAKVYAKLLIIIVIIVSTYKLPNILNKVTWENDIKTTTEIAKTLKQQIETNNLKNVNIAVLQSPDPNIYGRRYRDILLIDNMSMLSKEEYHLTDNLFVVSYSDIENIRKDEAYEIQRFNNGKLVNSWSFESSKWKLYLLNRNE